MKLNEGRTTSDGPKVAMSREGLVTGTEAFAVLKTGKSLTSL
jgi:hypothetical protein